ncbi:hypothetical protein C8J56DRAFT_854452 [Mycena floridula]|nr:hypothetical protein C8J56DRAFT_854452 [Mycena floridula]
MNFLDTYDIPNTPPANQTQTLNEEVSQVIGSLNSFWSWGRQQSQAALQTAKKDFGQVVTQAQKELSKLTSEAPAQTPETGNPTDDSAAPEASVVESVETPTASTSTVQTLFSRLQSAIPPNVISTVQNNLPESLKHPENIDLGQLRATLASEFERVQGVTRAQAEEYMHKSEIMLREVAKEAGEALREAVKVIPPEEAQASGSGLIWDGTDMWMLPSDPSEATALKGKGKASIQQAVATRAESLLKRLKHDPEILRHEPESDLYSQWLTAEVDLHEGGIESDVWTAKISAVLDESEDGKALMETQNLLVTSEMTKETFWKRYFFRVHQIAQEEEKRKALIQESIGTEEDFSWEDDEDEDGSAKPDPSLKRKSSTTTLQPSDTRKEEEVEKSAPSQKTSANTSPRESSEESYDVVSDRKADSDADADADSDWE